MRPDVVVVGAGVIGASCAYHLARAGLRVLVVDRDAEIRGSTARATGGFRAQFATAINIRLSLLARAKLRAFAEEVGADPGLDPVGYLFLASNDAELAALRAANALQQREGLTEARIVDRSDVAAINPAIDRSGIVGAAWCPSDGVLRPLAIARGYLDAAQRLGAEVRWNTPVAAIEATGSSVDASSSAPRAAASSSAPRAAASSSAPRTGARVVTSTGSIDTGLVVNAAGAWAGALADVPVTPLRRQVALTEPTAALPARFPMTIWLDGFHLRVRDGRVLLLRPTPGDPSDPWNDRVEPAWLDAIAELAPRRVPALRGVAIDRAASWAGLYEMSPDGHAILGFAAPHLLVVNGSSGHGVMHAPALGHLIAELATGAPPTIDIHQLRPARFSEGDPVVGSSLL